MNSSTNHNPEHDNAETPCTLDTTFKHVSFASVMDVAQENVERMLDDISNHGYQADTLAEIRLILQEAVRNAIKHGNRGDSSRQVTVRYAVAPHKVTMLVRDEGAGFDPDAVPDPTLEERLCKPSGRGILLMKLYADDLEYRNGGSEVCLVKHSRRHVKAA